MGGPKGGGQRGGGPKIPHFFPTPTTIFFLSSLSLGGPFVEFWWCLKRWGPETWTFEGPGASNTVRPVTGGPVNETSAIQTRSSEVRKDFNVEQAHERTGRPVITHDVINVSDNPQTLSAHESEMFNVGDETLRERTERSVADYDVSHGSIMVNEADMDFRISGLPHAVVKHAQSASVRGLIQKIENHPDRHALQQDLRQSHSFNPFSPESKQVIQDVGNIELCELLETEPKTQCKACLSYWNVGIVCYTCGHFLQKEPEVNRKFVKYTMDLLSVPEYVIKKRRPHGHRYGKKPWDK